MQANARVREGRFEMWRAAVPQIAEQIEDRAGPEHARVSEGQVAHRAHELLELARRAGDLGLVKGVVGARRELVHEQAPIAEQEQLDGEDALEPELQRD